MSQAVALSSSSLQSPLVVTVELLVLVLVLVLVEVLVLVLVEVLVLVLVLVEVLVVVVVVTTILLSPAGGQYPSVGSTSTGSKGWCAKYRQVPW
jgi:hypothetical protein